MSNITLYRGLELSPSNAAIDPLVLQREENALHHWLFGTDQPDYKSLTGSEIELQVVGSSPPPALAANYATVGEAGALLSPYWKANDFTVCGVCNYEGDNTGMYWGNYVGSGSLGLSVYGRATAQNGLQAITNAGTLNLNFPAGPFSDWCFFGLSVSGSIMTFYCPQSTTYSVTGIASPSVGETDKKFSIGNVHYATTPFGTEAAKVAESIMLDTALSLAEMEAIYARSVIRLGLRSITLA